ncbi:MAG: AMP-binding protein, partial [Planctomycetota bacterium]
MMLDRLRAHAEQHGVQVAIDDGQNALTFAQLCEWVDRWASQLTARAVVAAVLPGGPELTALGLACFSAKAVFVPLPKKATARELERFFSLVEPDLVATTTDRVDDVKPLLANRPSVPCVIPKLDASADAMT